MAFVQSDYKDGFTFTGLTGTAAGPYTILGGNYAFMAIDTGTADATLQMLGPDGSTYIPVHAAYTSTTFASFYLPPGLVEVLLGTGTSLSACLIRIPDRFA